jgi:hypothetical protein
VFFFAFAFAFAFVCFGCFTCSVCLYGLGGEPGRRLDCGGGGGGGGGVIVQWCLGVLLVSYNIEAGGGDERERERWVLLLFIHSFAFRWAV